MNGWESSGKGHNHSLARHPATSREAPTPTLGRNSLADNHAYSKGGRINAITMNKEILSRRWSGSILGTRTKTPHLGTNGVFRVTITLLLQNGLIPFHVGHSHLSMWTSIWILASAQSSQWSMHLWSGSWLGCALIKKYR